MPAVTGTDAIRKVLTEVTAQPGFSLTWTPVKADVSAGGDIGYTAGTYEQMLGGVSEKGKYVEIWKKQADGEWKATEDIFNADAPTVPPAQEATVLPGDLTWGDVPPMLPPGAKIAVVTGDPAKAGPFAIRLQFPAGYRVAPHWHPTDEQNTVLSGTLALGMGDAFDPAALKDLPAGGYSVIPAQMHHFAMAKTAVTLQVNGMGPFIINYVNPADDPSKKSQ